MSSPETNQKFRVFVRLRPATNQAPPSQEVENETQGERPLTSARGENGVCSVEHRIITLNDPAKGHSSEFVFDRVFGADTSQEAVFSEVAKPLIQHVVQGNNGCCFAYGQTGSGKTYSMFGKENSVDPSTRGIIPLSVFELFKVVEAAKASGGTGRFSIFVSLLEIYLEQVRDLGRGVQSSLESGLTRRHSSSSASGGSGGGNSSARGRSSIGGVLPKGARQGPSHLGEDWTTTSLDVMEDPSGTTIIKDMTYIEVTDPSEVMAIVNEAGRLRATAATLQNDVSSRSHTVFTLSVVQHRDARKPLTGRLHLVDLAGSERLSKSGSSSDSTRLAETKAINKSLSSLGKVVMSLTQGHGDKKGDGEKPAHHIPYRDSKLTRILKNSLQGNCLTHMLAALNPAPVHTEECFNTLQFAVRCQNLDLAPRINLPHADGSLPGGGHRMASDGGEGGEAEQLAQQVAALQEELDFTHAHYQKMMEGIAGPNWTSNLGPLERAAAEAVEQRASLTGGAKDGDQAALLGGAGFAMEMGMKGQGQEWRRLQTALEAARTKQKETEAALMRKRADADSLRDRLAAKDQMQLAEIRKLRAQVTDLTAHAHEVQVEEQSKADKARQLLAEEVQRLTHDNQVMRTQLERVTKSVNELIDKHTAHVSREEANREAMRVGIERSFGQQIEAAEKERVRQVDNLKQQSAHFLEQKTQEIFSLKSQMTQMRTEHELEAKQLRAEVDLLTTYAERLTELLQKMETGAYGVVEMSGIRSLKLPQKDRPAGLDLERLQQLRHCGDTVQRVLEMARAAAAKPGSRPASARPGSRPASALVATPPHTLAVAAALKAGSALPRSAPSSATTQPPGTRTQGPAHGAHPQTSSAIPVPTLGSLPLPPGCTSLSSMPMHQHRLQSQQQQQQQEKEQLQHQQQQQQQQQEGGKAEHHDGGSQWEPGKHQAVDGAQANAADDPNKKTLQYIRSLEEALAKQRAETFAERRRQGELTVALRSALRSARLPNPLQAALLNTPMGHLPHWGYGHNQLSNSLNGGLADASTLSQAPSWAAATMGGSAWSVNRPASAGISRSLGVSQVGAEGLRLMGRGSMGGSGAWRSRPLTAGPAGARTALAEGVLVQQ